MRPAQKRITIALWGLVVLAMVGMVVGKILRPHPPSPPTPPAVRDMEDRETGEHRNAGTVRCSGYRADRSDGRRVQYPAAPRASVDRGFHFYELRKRMPDHDGKNG